MTNILMCKIKVVSNTLNVKSISILLHAADPKVDDLSSRFILHEHINFLRNYIFGSLETNLTLTLPQLSSRLFRIAIFQTV